MNRYFLTLSLLGALAPVGAFGQSWQALHRQARQLFAESKPDSALSTGRMAYRLARTDPTCPDTLRAGVAHDVGRYAFKLGKYAESDSLNRMALTVFAAQLGRNSNPYLTTLNHQATVFSELGKRREAERAYHEVLDGRRDRGERWSVEYASVLSNLARLYQEEADYERAIRLFRESLETHQKINTDPSPDYFITLNNLAVCYTDAGQTADTERIFRQVLEHRAKQNQSNEEYLLALSNLGRFLWDQGRLSEAEPYFVQALRLGRVVYTNQPYLGRLAGNVAVFYKDMGRYEQAEPLYREALERAGQPDVPKEFLGSAHNNIGVFYRTTEQIAKAVEHYRQAVELYREMYGPQHPNYATTLSNLGNVLAQQRKFEEAESLQQTALTIRREKLGPRHAHYGISLSNLAFVYRLSGRWPQAIDLYQRADSLFKKQLGETHASTLGNLESLTWAYAQSGQFKAALRTFGEMYHLRARQVGLVFPSLTDSERERFQRTFAAAQEQFLTITERLETDSLATVLYQQQLFAKGLLLQSAQRVRRQLRAGGDSALLTLYDRWVSRRALLAKRASMPKATIAWERVQAEADSLEKALSYRSAVVSGALSAEKIPTLEGVQRQLRPDEAAIELLRYRQYDFAASRFTDTVRYVALVLRAGAKAPRLVRLPGSDSFENTALAAYQRGLLPDAAGHLPTDPDAESYNRFWKPLATALRGVKTLYLAPDGVYHQLSLSTLFNPATHKYLGEEINLLLLNSTRDRLSGPLAQAGKGALLFGHPAYRARREAGTNPEIALLPKAHPTLRGDSLLDLPETKTEVHNLSAQLVRAGIPTTVRTDTAASESALKRASRPRLLHVATHGFFKPSLSHEPLLQAGLALAGAADTSDHSLFSEDGLLTAYEAQHLDLTGTELVTLSACETGRGQVRGGEGVYGLQRAFALAGAQAVLMSLWKVSDRVTQEFMAEFYRNWLGGKSKPEALRLTQQVVRRAHPEPFYWGAFVLVGK